jgi:farnesyl-diphosphate farnesyltransferase
MRHRNSHLVSEDRETQMLQGVSRSFALTIPQLPPPLRSPVTNGYLLFRIADTIEDENNLSVEQKTFFFYKFIDVVEGKVPAAEFAAALLPLLSERTSQAEKELIRNAPLVVERTYSFGRKKQIALQRCASIMARGMQSFQEKKSLRGLKDLSQLNSYCYHVAGVVGELLTELFCEYSEEISKKRDRLFRLAPSFGQGLQMTNILKDLWDDRNRGVCWLPQDVFEKAGFDLRNLSQGKYAPSFGEGVARLIGIARSHLGNALSYSLMIPTYERGIRKFCLWAIGMAVFTLMNINKRPDFSSGSEVKISRRTLRAILLVADTSLRNNYLLKGLFRMATWSLPKNEMG